MSNLDSSVEKMDISFESIEKVEIWYPFCSFQSVEKNYLLIWTQISMNKHGIEPNDVNVSPVTDDTTK